jgi:hypothetical protein
VIQPETLHRVLVINNCGSAVYSALADNDWAAQKVRSPCVL